jgi:hypothetical protein
VDSTYQARGGSTGVTSGTLSSTSTNTTSFNSVADPAVLFLVAFILLVGLKIGKERDQVGDQRLTELCKEVP